MSIIQTLKKRLLEADLSFAEYMQLVLYNPLNGYYSSGLPKIGPQGDFITAPELSPIFGYALANQCQQIMNALNQPLLLEFGAGTGALCVSLLQRLEQLESLPETYYILELSADLRARQQRAIQQSIPHLATRVSWLETWPEKTFSGVILANEVLDAMPVHRFFYTGTELMESYITFDHAQKLIKEIFKPSHNERLNEHVTRRLPLEQDKPYLSEVNLFLDDWIAQLYHILVQGAVLLIDYGFPRHEYYHPERNHGTIMCHFQHQNHPDFLQRPGEQDITAHVDFTHVAEAAVAAGFHVAGYTNQAAFLLANNILDCLGQASDEVFSIKTKQALKQLTSPSEMGELFKVIALSKHMDIDFQGFQLSDKRAAL